MQYYLDIPLSSSVLFNEISPALVFLLLTVFALKHWHSSIVWYIFIAIVGWSEMSTNFLFIQIL